MSPECIARQRAIRRAMLGELYAARAEGRVVYARDLTAQAGQAEAEARFALDYLVEAGCAAYRGTAVHITARGIDRFEQGD